MKRIDALRISVSTMLLMLSINTSVAQTEFTPEYLAKTTSYRQRLGLTTRDSLKAEKLYECYITDSNKALSNDSKKSWRDVYHSWKKLVNVAPFASHNLTNLAAAWFFEQKLLPNEKNSKQRYAYFKDLMWLYDFRINHLDQLNAIPLDNGNQRNPLEIGPAMLQKAHAYHTLGMDSAYVPKKEYDKSLAYKNFIAAFDTIKAQGRNIGIFDDGENEIDPYYTEEYFLTGRELYLENKEKYLEQFLTDYTSILETCDMMMAMYRGMDSVKYEQYAMRRSNIEYYFWESGAGSTDNLQRFYSSRLADNKDNKLFLKKAIHLMIQQDSMYREDVFLKACKLSYMIEPDYENCIGMALIQKELLEDKDSALYYFKKAKQLARTPAEQYATTLNIGMALASEPAPSASTIDGWAEMSTAEHNNLVLSWRGRQRAAANVLNESLLHAMEAGKPIHYWAPIYYCMASAFRKAGEEPDLANAEECLKNVTLAHAPYAYYRQGAITYETDLIAAARERIAERRAQKAEYSKDKNLLFEIYLYRYAEMYRRQAEETAFWNIK